jgi:branched-subunit amino acid transport protein
MSTSQFLVLWLSSFAFILACRVVPVVALHGRPLSPRVVEALGYIPPAAFAALVANDLLSPTMFDAGLWAGLMPLVAAGVVVLVAWRTHSMLWCCVAGSRGICTTLAGVATPERWRRGHGRAEL